MLESFMDRHFTLSRFWDKYRSQSAYQKGITAFPILTPDPSLWSLDRQSLYLWRFNAPVRLPLVNYLMNLLSCKRFRQSHTSTPHDSAIS